MTLTGRALVALAVLASAILGAQTYAPQGVQSALGIAMASAAIAAMSGSLTRPDTQQIALIWAVKSHDQAFARHRLAAIAARHPGAAVHITASTMDGRLTAERLVAGALCDPRVRDVLLRPARIARRHRGGTEGGASDPAPRAFRSLRVPLTMICSQGSAVPPPLTCAPVR